MKDETCNTTETSMTADPLLTPGNFKPILFSTPMVQAILRGEKTQTRRIVKKPDILDMISQGFLNNAIMLGKYRVGDILWVRETWQHTKCLNINQEDETYGYVYKADGQPWEDYEEWAWKPSIFMPKDACRIFLKITKIRIERLNDITKEDAIAEGIEKWDQMGQTRYKSYVEPIIGFWDDGSNLQFVCVHPAIDSYRSLWAKINGFDSLNSNPWVFVYEFERSDVSFACR